MNTGVLLALAAYAVYAWGDGLIKSLGGELTIFQIGFFNILFSGLFLVLVKPAGEDWRNFWQMRRPIRVHARAAIGMAAGILSVYAFTSIPLTEVYALLFLAPLFVTLLSIIFLKERVGIWRWLAVLAGFVGVLMVVKPGLRALELGHLAALGGAFCAALSIILMRTMASERQTAVLGMLVAYGLAFNGAAAAYTGFAVPSWSILVILVLTGACTAAGSRLQFLATRHSPANLIAPTHYSQMIWAVLIGAAFFNEFPDAVSLIGLLIIAAAGLLTLLREQIRLGYVRFNRATRGRL
ncbi:DMT family transporter [Mesorhizobium denitrificans]|uniref:DMT family transporter n=1 Tax=Mesorhizobium denitrificans TaxID=2294114 RepID=A0A371XEF7_9HYPH|nr:DMT family transporter [Mesorhizobium denitrificans]